MTRTPVPRSPSGAGRVDYRALQPQLPYRNLDDIVQKVSAQFFRHAFDDITWCFVIQRMLA
jgi:hypothetical protein